MTESQVTCLPFFWKFLYKRFEFNLVCAEFQNWKDFLLLYSQFENKKSKNANLFARVAFLSALLSYAFSFEAKISFVNRCICAFWNLGSSNGIFLKMFLFGICCFEHGFLALVVYKVFFMTAMIIINYSYLLNMNFLQ